MNGVGNMQIGLAGLALAMAYMCFIAVFAVDDLIVEVKKKIKERKSRRIKK